MSAGNPILNNEQGPFERAPELATRAAQPGGVIRRNLKMQVYLGIAVLFIIATAVSSLRHKATPKQQNLATPMAQTSDANIEEMKKSLELQQRQPPPSDYQTSPKGLRPRPIHPLRILHHWPTTAFQASPARPQLHRAISNINSNCRRSNRSRCNSCSKNASWRTKRVSLPI